MRFGAQGYDDGTGSSDEIRGCDAGEPGISAGGTVEVGGGRVAGVGVGFEDEVSEAAGFEGARGLEVFEFEEDSTFWRASVLEFFPVDAADVCSASDLMLGLTILLPLIVLLIRLTGSVSRVSFLLSEWKSFLVRYWLWR